MLSDNIKNLRKLKGLSQEELAVRLNVVRQTVSKWETGLSVPDSEMLIKIAGVLEATVAELLDETVEFDENCELKVIAEKLAIVNEQIANHNESRRKILRAVFIVVSVLAVCSLIGSLIGAIHFQLVMNNMNASTSVIGGYDGPTNIFVSRTGFRFVPFVLSMIIAVVSFAGIYKTRKK